MRLLTSHTRCINTVGGTLSHADMCIRSDLEKLFFRNVSLLCTFRQFSMMACLRRRNIWLLFLKNSRWLSPVMTNLYVAAAMIRKL